MKGIIIIYYYYIIRQLFETNKDDILTVTKIEDTVNQVKKKERSNPKSACLINSNESASEYFWKTKIRFIFLEDSSTMPPLSGDHVASF